MRYAKMKADQMAEEMAGALQAIPAASRERAASMKGTVTSSITGRNGVIQGVNAGEKGRLFPAVGIAAPISAARRCGADFGQRRRRAAHLPQNPWGHKNGRPVPSEGVVESIQRPR